MGDFTIRPLVESDWLRVRQIYADGIATGHATFEQDPPGWSRFDDEKLSHSRFVAVAREADVVGWVAASRVSSRTVYAGVVEHSLYVAESARGRGIGRSLLDAFIQSAEDHGIWTIQSSVFPENSASLELHATFGFRVVGRRERIARMGYGPLAGQWRDTILLERRSTTL